MEGRFILMKIISGKVERAQKAIIYGPEGIGKSTLAAAFPNPLFIDTEYGSYKIDVKRLPRPSSWMMLLDEVRYVKQNPSLCRTLVIDTADWAEQLCVIDVCAKYQKESIEDFGYGKGYVKLTETFGKLLNLLEEVVDSGVHVVMTAHAKMRRFDQPDELGGYDRWEMKLNQKGPAALAKEWADMVLFVNYKTFAVNVDGQGATKGKNKGQGGKRVMYATHHPCWDAKNRHDLPEELPLDFNAIAHCFPINGLSAGANPPPEYVPPVASAVAAASVVDSTPPITPVEDPVQSERYGAPAPEPAQEIPATEEEIPTIPASLGDLMHMNGVTVEEIQRAVAAKGYYPADTPIGNYDPDYIEGVLVGAWDQVFKKIKDIRAADAASMETPF